VLDDDKSILRLYYRTLTRNGFKVDCTAHSSETIRRFQQAVQAGEPYNAVIVDLTIPGDVGGEETVRRLREIGPGVKALICSGYANNPVMSDFAGHGFQGVVAKPFRPDELVEALHRAIHGEGAEADRPIEIPGQPASGGRR
jgi:DNA-binding NtrC family response regulator